MLHVRIAGAVGLLALAVGCGNPADIEAIKKGQADILAKLETVEKAVAAIKSAPAAAAGRPQVDPNKIYPLQLGNSPVEGDPNGKVVLVEFSDYQCPFCAQANTQIHEVLKAYPKGVKFAYKQFPLTSIHPNAMPASKAALAAGKQGKYWELHAILFENSRELSADKLKEYAGRVGLDMARWEKDMASPEIQKQVDTEMAEAKAADVTGTPTVFINGKRVTNRSVEGMKTMIDEALKAG